MQRKHPVIVFAALAEDIANGQWVRVGREGGGRMVWSSLMGLLFFLNFRGISQNITYPYRISNKNEKIP
jgi:hypothetical protein